MTQTGPTFTDGSNAPASAGESPAPNGWSELREDTDIQFEPVVLKPPEPAEPAEPGWFEEAFVQIFGFLAELLAPLGRLLFGAWPVLGWVLLGLLVVFVLYVIVRTLGPLAGRNRKADIAESKPEWQPDREESLALLEDADQLAAEGRFDEATRLLLQRSVSQIANARPDWVDPSSTARELAALPALSDGARSAFAMISQRVENSLFALRPLDRADWETARSAYADFALARIDGGGVQHRPKSNPRRELAV